MPRTAYRTKQKSGPKPKPYRVEYCRMAYQAAKDGWTETQIGTLFNLSQGGVQQWRKVHPKFNKAIREGWYAFTTLKVEKALRKTCLGYEYKEVTTEDIFLKGKGKDAVKIPATKQKITTKCVQPNIMAIIFWLTNRTPELWQHVQKTIFSGKVQQEIESELNATVEQNWNLKSLSKEDLNGLKNVITKLSPSKSNQIKSDFLDPIPIPN